MQQSSKIVEFMIIELINRTLKTLSHLKKHSLLQECNSEISAKTIFYMNDIFDEHKNFFTAFLFLRDHFLFKIE